MDRADYELGAILSRVSLQRGALQSVRDNDARLEEMEGRRE